jgi:hypothetical protein
MNDLSKVRHNFKTILGTLDKQVEEVQQIHEKTVQFQKCESGENPWANRDELVAKFATLKSNTVAAVDDVIRRSRSELEALRSALRLWTQLYEQWGKAKGELRLCRTEEESQTSEREFQDLKNNWTAFWDVVNTMVPKIGQMLEELKSQKNVPGLVKEAHLQTIEELRQTAAEVKKTLLDKSILISVHPFPIVRDRKRGEMKLRLMNKNLVPHFTKVSLFRDEEISTKVRQRRRHHLALQ